MQRLKDLLPETGVGEEHEEADTGWDKDKYHSLKDTANDKTNSLSTVSGNLTNRNESVNRKLTAKKTPVNFTSQKSKDSDAYGKVVENITNDLGRSDALATRISIDLEAKEWKDYYLGLIKVNDHQVFAESLAETLDAHRRGKIRTSKSRYFWGILMNKGINLPEHSRID